MLKHLKGHKLKIRHIDTLEFREDRGEYLKLFLDIAVVAEVDKNYGNVDPASMPSQSPTMNTDDVCHSDAQPLPERTEMQYVWSNIRGVSDKGLADAFIQTHIGGCMIHSAIYVRSCRLGLL